MFHTLETLLAVYSVLMFLQGIGIIFKKHFNFMIKIAGTVASETTIPYTSVAQMNMELQQKQSFAGRSHTTRDMCQIFFSSC